MFNICSLAYEMIASELFVLIDMIICFLEGSFVVMLNFGLPFNPLLLMTL